jgi:hypothetical protein
MRFAVIDLANLFFRIQHSTQGDAFTRSGMALHMIFRSLRQLYRDMKVDHLVFCAEGRSWRYDVYPQYKAKRKLDRLNQSDREREDGDVFMEVLGDLTNYLAEKTNCTVLQSDGVEGDDFIARWVQLHPDDEHVILSGDSDFIQLLAPNVTIVDGVQKMIISMDGVKTTMGEECVFHVNPKNGKIKIEGTLEEAEKKHIKAQKELAKEHDAKVKVLKEAFLKENKTGKFVPPKPFVAVPFAFNIEKDWWKKALFIKIIRGDIGDGIFAAYPGVRYEGSKNKTGIREAWDDRTSCGYNWNNFMLQQFDRVVGHSTDGDPISQTTKVIDEFRKNELLIDLTKQPEKVLDLADTVILQAVDKDPVSGVGIHFLRFCGKNDLNNLSKEAQDHSNYLGAPYIRK